MGIEIEKKFLVESIDWLNGHSQFIRQGYLCTDIDRTVRVRRANDKGYITIKGSTLGATRQEYEYEIPVKEADELLESLCLEYIIEKHRYAVLFGGKTWEIDIFKGMNEGLYIAEIELTSEEENFKIPDWAGKEVTGLPEYYNSQLSKNPFTLW